MKEKFKIRFWDKDLKKVRSEMFGKGCFNHPNIIPLIGCEVNGQLVYDGDLLESINQEDGSVSKIPVVFENGAFWVDESFHKDGTYLHLLAEWDEKIKVIGNIYEK